MRLALKLAVAGVAVYVVFGAGAIYGYNEGVRAERVKQPRRRPPR